MGIAEKGGNLIIRKLDHRLDYHSCAATWYIETHFCMSGP